MTTALQVHTDPAEVGIDPARLARWVDSGQLPGFLVTVARHGRLVHVGRSGMRDVENGLPVEEDTRWRIFSMTKPVTSVAAMMLYEEGAFELTDPIAKWLPEFAETRVYVAGSAQKPVTQPQVEPIRVWHLLTHTAGLTYGFHHAHPVDALYRLNGHEWGTPPGADSAEVCRQWASAPLVFQPGSEWNYGVSTDVLGRLVEVVSGLLTVERTQRSARTGRNPQTGESIDIPAANTVKVTPGSNLKKAASSVPV